MSNRGCIKSMLRAGRTAVWAICFGALAFTSAKGAEQAKRALTHERDVQTTGPWEAPPRWDGTTLVGVVSNRTRGPVLYWIDRDGRRDEALFTIEDASTIWVDDVAGSQDGYTVAVGAALTSDVRGTTFLARISPDRQSQVVTRTWPYCPMVVTFAADGKVWTVGHLFSEDGNETLAYNVLRVFDKSGKLVGSTKVATKGIPGEELSFLRASRDRVGWLNRSNEYFEFGPDMTEIGRFKGPELGSDREITGFALSEDGDAIVSTFGKEKTDFLFLDRATGVWTPLSTGPASFRWARAAGFDGSVLVLYEHPDNLKRFLTK